MARTCCHVAVWPIATNFSLGPDVSFRDEAEVDRAVEFAVSVEHDPTATLDGGSSPSQFLSWAG